MMTKVKVLPVLTVLAIPMALAAQEVDTVDDPDADLFLIHGTGPVTTIRGRPLRLRRVLHTRRQGCSIMAPLIRVVHHSRIRGCRGTHQ